MAGAAVALYDKASEPRSIAGSDRVLSWAPDFAKASPGLRQGKVG